MNATGIGAAVRRKEDFRFITGKGQYTDDVSRPGQTCIHFLRSPHAHAKIKKIDAGAAKEMPGVLAVLTGAEREDAAGKLVVEFEVLPAVADPARAQHKGVVQIHEVAPHNTIYQWHLGDAKAVDGAIKSAKHVTKLHIVNNRLRIAEMPL